MSETPLTLSVASRPWNCVPLAVTEELDRQVVAKPEEFVPRAMD